MQSVTRQLKSPMFWGIATIAFVTVISLVVAWVYVNPPKQQTITFYTDDAVSITPGDTVRVAGVIVGKVKDLAIEPDSVRVRATLDSTAFVGDQSQIQVRMLTVVGGYYVTVIPLGDLPLGSKAIPKERVTMPYSLIRSITDATKITDNVNTAPLNESLNRVQQGLTGTNTDALSELIKAGNAMTENLERQRGQITEILGMSNEFIGRLNDNRELLDYLLRRVAILEQSLVLYGKGFATAIDGLGEVGRRLDPLARFYMPHRQDFLDRVRGALGEFQAIADRNGVLVRVLRRIRGRMERTLEAQNNYATSPTFGGTPGAPELFATDLCIPVEGSRC
ncbi:MlaD family protein [Mycolicibacterium porcinum]|uniref:MCE family protein n=1 Tax=Mycolicibacterium porcinum TaxID=39693 RepID=A0AAW5SV94_9MYCO|nr:MlaD family protein [Mycolicibacterium porcinum]MCV7386499.1 MCE family protein [Mycolicibacterium porcinum]ORB39009.1 MCE family protein [Mycolicibacterium porcinum]CDO30830.1 MCE-family protein Mce6C [Mycolicibacterium vulneris]